MLRSVAAFTACLLGSLILAGLLVPPPPRFVKVERKMADFERYGIGADVIAFGSSYVQNQLDPDSIETLTGMTVYNLGLPACRGHEMEAVVRRVLDMDPPNFRYALIDIADWPTRNSLEGAASMDAATSFQAVRWAARNGDVAGVGMQIAGLAFRYVPIGAGYGPPTWKPGRYRDDGFWVSDLPPMGSESEPLEIWNDPRRVDVQGLMRIERLLEERGITVVFVRFPIAYRFGEETARDYDGLRRVVWHDDPARFPSLYAPRNRSNHAHMAGPGVVRYNRIAVPEIVALMSAPDGLSDPDL
jgi:hypothetical protein